MLVLHAPSINCGILSLRSFHSFFVILCLYFILYHYSIVLVSATSSQHKVVSRFFLVKTTYSSGLQTNFPPSLGLTCGIATSE